MTKHRERGEALSCDLQLSPTLLTLSPGVRPLGKPPSDLPLPIKELEPTVLESSNSSVSYHDWSLIGISTVASRNGDYHHQPYSEVKMVAADSVPRLQIGVDTRQVNDK